MDFLVSDEEQYEAEPSVPTPPPLPGSPLPAPGDSEAWQRLFESGAFEDTPDIGEDPVMESPESTRSSSNEADSDTSGSVSDSFVLDLFNAEESEQPPGSTCKSWSNL
jgi:hypothetical protein